MRSTRTSSVLVAFVLSMLSATAGAALAERLGGLAYYDTDLGITWLADANAALGSGFDDGTGRMTWDNAIAWASALNVGGVTGWRLASMDVDGSGTPPVDCSAGGVIGCNDNEYGYLFYEEGIYSAAQDVFGSSIQSGFYWSGTEDTAAPVNLAWRFNLGAGPNSGLQSTANKSTTHFAWAVYQGDVSAVPVPAAVWLFGSGLLAMVGLARRRKYA